METNKLYRNDVYLKEIDATLTSVSADSKGLLLTFDKTIFFPTGGGQSCDLGKINDFPVIDVFEKEENVFHLISLMDEKGEKINSPIPKVGEIAHLSIDWERRFDNMQRHCGEHILSGIFYKLYGGVNRGFHMGEDYLTIDISLEDNPEFKEITWDMAKVAELETNKVIWQDLPVTAHHFDSREEAEKMPLRKKLAIEEDITIVTIGSESEPADSVACCGTHPSGAGQVGLVKIYKVEPNKGMFRIFFEAGERAFKNYVKSYDTMLWLEKDLSAGPEDLISKYQSRQEKQTGIKDRLYKLTKEAINREIESINDILSLQESETGSPRQSLYFDKAFDLLTIDDVIEIGRGLAGSLPKLLFLLHKKSSTLLLFSDTQDCGKLVKDNVAVFNGKGGGNKDFARAIFKDNQDAELFMTAVKTLI